MNRSKKEWSRTIGCKRDADGCDGSVLISWDQIDPWNKVLYNKEKIEAR